MDPVNERVGAAIGPELKRRREQRGLSAAELARRAGIGKASLSSIEAGRGNPTIDTLAALAAALHLPLTDLFDDPVASGTVHRLSTAQPDGEISRELLRRVSVGHSTEIWRLRMPAHTRMDGIPHASGTTEHLLVASGQVLAGLLSEPVTIKTGDFLSFPGDLPHRYETFDSEADVTVFLVSPSLT
ncbi:helix-turn-helix domain-containing protein [Rhodococcus sp. WS1]|uniref:helix-turn-helix domain-containing protein n=1 Tax=unclassified Rhodococcus (in: high G+C Gram-positive bacteria) TaxID=192944 RepID=UPI00114162D0|nr:MULTISPECIES: XRE family transcriptional regulator [unclassified Rhodococcus (in: high G+C Gram-positive bacteria)]ROZ52877.1 helix-turn-helix domain-containing protein [Rhodococcus sp. WS1]TQC35969.1 helix-turn-helix domain-containing protein [Rhodococcus sp. WS7]